MSQIDNFQELKEELLFKLQQTVRKLSCCHKCKMWNMKKAKTQTRSNIHNLRFEGETVREDPCLSFIKKSSASICCCTITELWSGHTTAEEFFVRKVLHGFEKLFQAAWCPAVVLFVSDVAATVFCLSAVRVSREVTFWSSCRSLFIISNTAAWDERFHHRWTRWCLALNTGNYSYHGWTIWIRLPKAPGSCYCPEKLSQQNKGVKGEGLKDLKVTCNLLTKT